MSKTSPDLSRESSAAPTAGFDAESFIDQRIAEHGLLMSERPARLRELACEAVEANADIAELGEMDQKIACFCNDLPECCRREEQMVFPALRRLCLQSHISSCKAGMVAARLRFTVAEQQMLLSTLVDAIEILRRHLSPAGPCESCHRLLHEAASFASELGAHIRLEQEELFAWAVAREAKLVQKR